MSKEIRIICRDDFDQSPDATTVSFGYAGKPYEIDLSEQNRKIFDELIQPYITHGRRPQRPSEPEVVEGPIKKPIKPMAIRRDHLRRVRNWARNNGFPVNPKGYVSQEARRAYNRTHPDDQYLKEATP